MSYTWHAPALIAAHTALLARLDTGGAAHYLIYDADDVLLATLPLTEPAGSVDAAGVLTLTPGAPESSAPAGGVASYAVLAAGDDAALLTQSVVEGLAPVAGAVAISTLNIAAGQSVELLSAQIG